MTRDFVALDTFPKILRDNAAVFKGRPSIREKEYGIWQITTWNNFFDKALLLAEGFYNSGLRRGDKIAIIGDNRPNLYLSIASAQILGAIPVPCYQDSVADEIQYILEHAEAKLAVVENQEQVDKLLEIKEKLPLLKNIFYSDPRGLEKYNEKIVFSLETIFNNSKEIDVDLDQEINKTSKDDISIMLYTSGTTGRPKGVLLSYNNIISVTSVACEIEKTNSDDEVVAYLPMAWVGDNIFCVAQSYISGFCINCPESRDTLTLDMREIGPTYYFAPPRVWEGMLTQLMVRMQDASKVKLWVFNFL
jgi:long-chain acyl-CoA synthetase